MQILIFSALGAMGILFAFYAFRLAAFSYVFTGGGGAVLVLAGRGEELLYERGEWADCGGGVVSRWCFMLECGGAGTLAIRLRW